MNGVVVEVIRGVEPRIELLLSVPHASREDVCVDDVGLSGLISEELKVYLVMLIPCRRQLQGTWKAN